MHNLFNKPKVEIMSFCMKPQNPCGMINQKIIYHYQQLTRQFSNHESHLLLWSLTFAIIIIFDVWTKGCMLHMILDDLWPHNCYVHMTSGWALTPLLLRSHVQLYVWPYPRIIVSKSHEKNTKYTWILWPFFPNLTKRSMTQKVTYDPTSVVVKWQHYPIITVFQSHGNIS